MMVDLLKTQDYIAGAGLYDGEMVDYDLERFSQKPLPPLPYLACSMRSTVSQMRLQVSSWEATSKKHGDNSCPKWSSISPNRIGISPDCGARSG